MKMMEDFDKWEHAAQGAESYIWNCVRACRNLYVLKTAQTN